MYNMKKDNTEVASMSKTLIFKKVNPLDEVK